MKEHPFILHLFLHQMQIFTETILANLCHWVEELFDIHLCEHQSIRGGGLLQDLPQLLGEQGEQGPVVVHHLSPLKYQPDVTKPGSKDWVLQLL